MGLNSSAPSCWSLYSLMSRASERDARRGFRAIPVAAIVVGWATAVLVAVWRVAERRRRYLPAIVVVMAIVAFAAIPFSSYVYQILYNRPIYGIRRAVYVKLLACRGSWPRLPGRGCWDRNPRHNKECSRVNQYLVPDVLQTWTAAEGSVPRRQEPSL